MGLAVEMWPIDRPIPYARNARKLSARAIDVVAASLKEYGWQQPIVVDAKGVIIAGHTRLLAAKKLGLTEVPVHVALNLTPGQVKAYRLMDNRSHDESSWDIDLLGPELVDMKALDVDLGLSGFDLREIDGFLIAAGDVGGANGLTDPDATPEVPVNPVTVPGDLWLLGDHRVLCGDSTSVDATSRLLAGNKAGLVFTDPPYGVGYDGGTTVRSKLVGDENTDLYGPACSMAAEFSVKEAALYLWHAGVKGIAAAAAAAAAGYEIRSEIIWNKNLAQFGSLSAQYKQKHEPCYYCFRKGTPPQWFGPTNEVTVWDVDRANKNEFHPTQKPVALAERALTNSSKEGDLVLDLFGGSGSTLIGCEKTRRRALVMEIDPKYVDVIVKRWQEFAGKTATLEGDGRTFSELSEERLKAATKTARL